MLPGALCDHCGLKPSNAFCGKCKKIAYCGPECQKADWKEHKKICGQVTGNAIKAKVTKPEQSSSENAVAPRPVVTQPQPSTSENAVASLTAVVNSEHASRVVSCTGKSESPKRSDAPKPKSNQSMWDDLEAELDQKVANGSSKTAPAAQSLLPDSTAMRFGKKDQIQPSKARDPKDPSGPTVSGISRELLDEMERQGYDLNDPYTPEKFKAMGGSPQLVQLLEIEVGARLQSIGHTTQATPESLRIGDIWSDFDSSQEPELARRAERGLIASSDKLEREVSRLCQAGIDAERDFKPEEGLKYLRKAAELDPRSWFIHDCLGTMLRSRGYLQEALAEYKKAMKLCPANPTPRIHALLTTRVTRDMQPTVENLEEHYETKSEAEEGDVDLLFALGKARDDLGDKTKAWKHWEAANRIRLKQQSKLEPSQSPSIEVWKSLCDENWLRRHVPDGSSDDGAGKIFIVGLPRCGSTLVERILTMHDGVFGLEENKCWRSALHRWSVHVGRPFPDTFPHAYQVVPDDDIEELAAAYDEEVRQMASMFLGKSPPAKTKFVDKQLDNLFDVGLISYAMPAARIVVLVRDPRDSALSQFTIRLGPEHDERAYDYTSDWKASATQHANAMALSRRWADRLPRQVMLLKYEDVVANPEKAMKSVCKHVGLTFKPESIEEFHKRKGDWVRTASSAQVRKPIYGSSVGRWKKYEKEMASFLNALPKSALQDY